MVIKTYAQLTCQGYGWHSIQPDLQRQDCLLDIIENFNQGIVDDLAGYEAIKDELLGVSKLLCDLDFDWLEVWSVNSIL